MSSDFTVPDDPFLAPLMAALKRYPKRLVFTEGEDDRVLRVAGELASRELAIPVLLGRVEAMSERAQALGIDLSFIRLIDPSKSPERERFTQYFERSERIRGNQIADASEMIGRPHYFGAMMLQYGQADGLVSGNQSVPATVFRAVKRMLKPLPEVKQTFSMVVITDRPESPSPNFGSDGFLMLADCNMLIDPDTDELAMVAVECGRLASEYLRRPARVALLSHSNLGTANSESSRRVAAATTLARQLAKQRNLDLSISGEVQVDVAMNPKAAESKGQRGQHQPADVLVFPNQDAGHIAYKLLVHVGGFPVYGQMVVGLAGPVSQLPRNAPEAQIFGTALMVGAEAIQYHSMYPRGLY